jgi:hypothetical protein
VWFQCDPSVWFTCIYSAEEYPPKKPLFSAKSGTRDLHLIAQAEAVCREEKRMEKLDYMHCNPVQRGLIPCPEDWMWSRTGRYATGKEGPVEIASTARRGQQPGVYPEVGCDVS